MKREVVRSLRKALSIVLILGSIFVFMLQKWLIGAAMLVAAFLVTSGDEPAARPRAGRDTEV